jgi:hypothetical protein
MRCSVGTSPGTPTLLIRRECDSGTGAVPGETLDVKWFMGVAFVSAAHWIAGPPLWSSGHIS